MSVRLAPAADVRFELPVTMLWDAPENRICLPTSVDEIPVRVIVRNPGERRRAAASGELTLL